MGKTATGGALQLDCGGEDATADADAALSWLSESKQERTQLTVPSPPITWEGTGVWGERAVWTMDGVCP